MILELKPEHQEILKKATASGMTTEEVLDRAFEIIRSENEMADWMMENREEIAAKLQRGFEQSELGDLIDGEEAIRMLEERHRQRQIA